jgi:uncharacterized membrane protein YhhN
MSIIVLSAFAVTATVHLLALVFRKERIRRISKVCLLPLLLTFYFIRAERLLPALIPAGILGWLGDIFLIRIRNDRYFKLGLAAFLLGHLCYILTILSLTEDFNIPVLGVSVAAAIPLGILVLRWIKPEGAMRVPTIIYGIIIQAMSLCALQFMLYRQDALGIAVFTGSLFFLFSDSVLAYFTFRTTPRYGHILVMLSYSIAQASIIIALAGC